MAGSSYCAKHDKEMGVVGAEACPACLAASDKGQARERLYYNDGTARYDGSRAKISRELGKALDPVVKRWIDRIDRADLLLLLVEGAQTAWGRAVIARLEGEERRNRRKKGKR